MLRTCRLAHLSVCVWSVCLSVRRVYCGKTAEWIRMPFVSVSGVGRGMDVLDGWLSSKGKGQFWGEFGACPLSTVGHFKRF